LKPAASWPKNKRYQSKRGSSNLSLLYCCLA
jgi:hypothetical protein